MRPPPEFSARERRFYSAFRLRDLSANAQPIRNVNGFFFAFQFDFEHRLTLPERVNVDFERSSGKWNPIAPFQNRLKRWITFRAQPIVFRFADLRFALISGLRQPATLRFVV